MTSTPRTDSAPPLLDLEPPTDTFSEEVLAGLTADPKSIPSKFFYDARGSELFDEICELDEYYLTRTELSIMEAHVDEMADRLGPRALLVEYGSGSSMKTRILLAHMRRPAGYVPIDISREHLMASATDLQREFPSIEVLPVCADYTDKIRLPKPSEDPNRVAVYFPGSTIGNFHPYEAEAFLGRIHRVAGAGGALLIGVDLEKDTDVLHAAYNDARGVTAAFNKNLLERINREIGGTFRLDAFEHEAVYNERTSRIEMYLVSQEDQTADVAGETFPFVKGEKINTEYSYKYSLPAFHALASRAGFEVGSVWMDERHYFSIQYLLAR